MYLSLILFIGLGILAIVLLVYLFCKHESIYPDTAICIAIIAILCITVSMYFAKSYHQQLIDKSIRCYIFNDYDSYVGTDDQEHYILIEPDYD